MHRCIEVPLFDAESITAAAVFFTIRIVCTVGSSRKKMNRLYFTAATMHNYRYATGRNHEVQAKHEGEDVVQKFHR